MRDIEVYSKYCIKAIENILGHPISIEKLDYWIFAGNSTYTTVLNDYYTYGGPDGDQIWAERVRKLALDLEEEDLNKPEKKCDENSDFDSIIDELKKHTSLRTVIMVLALTKQLMNLDLFLRSRGWQTKWRG